MKTSKETLDTLKYNNKQTKNGRKRKEIICLKRNSNNIIFVIIYTVPHTIPSPSVIIARERIYVHSEGNEGGMTACPVNAAVLRSYFMNRDNFSGRFRFLLIFDSHKHTYRQHRHLFFSGPIWLMHKCKKQINVWQKRENLLKFARTSHYVYLLSVLSKVTDMTLKENVK